MDNLFPQHYQPPSQSSPQSRSSPTMAGRKRGAEEMDSDVHMASMSPSPRPQHTTIKRARTDDRGRPLPIARLLETMDLETLRDILTKACDSSPQLAAHVTQVAPNPSVSAALEVIKGYQRKFEESFPYGGTRTSSYDYDRVKQPLLALLTALGDFTSSFLPPQDVQIGTTLQFLDGATNILHGLPDFEGSQHSYHKSNAYEQLAKAWCVALAEAEKKSGGIMLTSSGWDRKLRHHYEQAGQGLYPAIQELQRITSWSNTDDRVQNLLSGRSGMNGDIIRNYRVTEITL